MIQKSQLTYDIILKILLFTLYEILVLCDTQDKLNSLQEYYLLLACKICTSAYYFEVTIFNP